MNNDINILPFYGSVKEQNHRKLHTYGDVFNLIASDNSFIPFQFVRAHREDTTINAELYDLKDSLVSDITQKMNVVIHAVDEYDMLINYGNDFVDKLDAGIYYIKLSDGVETWYSEAFTVVSDLSNYMKVEYWDNSDIIMDGWKILYSEGFKFRLYLQSAIGKPEYKFEEEIERRDNNAYFEKQISSKTFRFSFLAPEYLCDAIRVIRMHDNVTIKEGDKLYDATAFTVNPKWDNRGDIAQVLAEFETDTNIKKIAKSEKWKAPQVFRGALLANMNDPVLFAQSSIVLFTEKYQEDLQGTAFVGKLIRQLDIEIEVTDQMEIAVDKGTGDAKKMNLVDAVRGVVEKKDFKTKGKFEFEELIDVGEGIKSNDFLQGINGVGACLNKQNDKWHAEADSLTLRDFLEVPELRFNRIDVISGDSWNAIAYGTIESVDTETQIATVKLLDGELLTSHVNDICRGVFYNIGDGTGKEVDSNGFVQMQGFGTAYFTPVELLPDGKSFRYALQSGTTIHPCKAMKYVSYGNFTDKSRQASKYSTRTYTRYLRNVNTWNIIPDKNIVAQFGEIEGLTIGGVTMHGTGSYLNNIYMTGVSIQFTPEQLEDMKGNDAYSVCLSSPTATIKKSVNGVISYQEEMNVVSGESNVISGDSDIVASTHLLRTQIQAFKGVKPMFYSDIMQPYAYTVETYPVNCECTIDGGVLAITTITDLSQGNAYVDMDVNCEGNTVISLRYSITIVEDGTNGRPGDNGTDAVSYNFISPVTSIRKNSLGFFEPSSFEVTLKKSVGSTVVDCSDKYLTVFGSENGSNWDRVSNSVVSSSVAMTPQASYNMYSVIATDGYNPSFSDSSYAMIGINVVDGQMVGSFPRNCGEWKKGKPYEYTANFRDCVYIKEKDETATRVFMVKSFGKSLTDVHPLVGSIISDEWIEGNVEQFTAINTALIDGADIAGFQFKSGILQSKDTNSSGVPNIQMNGETGELTALKGSFKGHIEALSGNFGCMGITNEGISLYSDNVSGMTSIISLGWAGLSVNLKKDGVWCGWFGVSTQGDDLVIINAESKKGSALIVNGQTKLNGQIQTGDYTGITKTFNPNDGGQKNIRVVNGLIVENW